MAGRHSRSECRKPREYLSALFRDIERFPGYAAGFYGGIVLVLLGVVIGLAL